MIIYPTFILQRQRKQQSIKTRPDRDNFNMVIDQKRYENYFSLLEMVLQQLYKIVNASYENAVFSAVFSEITW